MKGELGGEGVKDIIGNCKGKIICIYDMEKGVGDVFEVKLEDLKAKKGRK
nr:hypothetical protein [Bacillus mycoides]